MALLNAEEFGDLAGVSLSQTTRKPGKFFNISICGKRRGDQQPGTYQCPKSYDDKNSEYFVHNQNEVLFIPLYIKRYWTKYKTATSQQGQEYQKLVAFGWDEKTPKAEGAKFEYIVAGFLLDQKGIAKHTSAFEDREINAGDPVLVYFKCVGMKCGCAYELVDRINKAAKDLKPISDNPKFEADVIVPRRFIIKAGIVSKDSSHGAFDVFDFNPIKTLDDDAVLNILKESKKYLPDFDYQFNKSNNNFEDSASSEGDSQEASAGVDITEVPSTQPTNSGTDQFSIDL